MSNTIAVIQARMGSNRLPQKVMMDIQGRPMIWHIIERVKQANLIDRIVVATSTKTIDNPLENYLKSNGILCYRGSENNVLERFYEASFTYGGDTIVRLTGDNPLIDPRIIDKTISFFYSSGLRYVSNIQQPEGKCTFPVGIACEVFSAELLKEAYYGAQEAYEKEHVTPYMYYKQKSIGCYSNNLDVSNYRFTVDTIEDFNLVQAIYAQFFKGKHNFYLDDVIAFLKEHPELAEINANIKQRKAR